MAKSICISILLLAFLSARAQLQKDPAAGKILDRYADRARGDFPLQISFEYVYESLVDNETQEEPGSIILMDNKFRLRFGDSDIFCDGRTIWNHLPMAGEVYISDAGDSQAGDDFFLSNPEDIFTFYQDGFKYQLKGETEQEGHKVYEINLYPDDLNGNYHTIKLMISSEDYSLYSAEALGKNGINHTVVVRDYRRKVKTDEGTFVFNPGDHPGVEIIDTRL